jgi:hypothetical protein
MMWSAEHAPGKRSVARRKIDLAIDLAVRKPLPSGYGFLYPLIPIHASEPVSELKARANTSAALVKAVQPVFPED